MSKLLCIAVTVFLAWLVVGGCLSVENPSVPDETKSETQREIERIQLQKQIYNVLLEILEESKGELTVRREDMKSEKGPLSVPKEARPASIATAGNYFWHNEYHKEPHDPKCRDTVWHPYLRPDAEFGGDLAKYELIDAQPEEIDVSSYPEHLQKIYNESVRGFCAACHTPARMLHQNYTPRQWKSSLLLLRSRYKDTGYTKDMETQLYEFFVYYEDKKLQQETSPVERRESLSTAQPTTPETAVKGNYFWHNEYHNEPHDSKCRDVVWHPYLKADADFGGDPAKYELIDAQAEEIDVSSYPEHLRETYSDIVRGFCASCHTPARMLHQNYTPRQWKSSLVMLRSRYQSLGYTKNMERQLYEFFVYYENKQLEEETPPAERPESPSPSRPDNSTAPETAVKGNYFWHNEYHNEPHDSKCRDVAWHPYLRADADFGGDPAKYELIDAQAEEIDVSDYPGHLKESYRGIVRGFCASCHTPARMLHQNYTPRQWKSSLSMLRSRYQPLGYTTDMEQRLYEFFIYYEEQKLQEEDR